MLTLKFLIIAVILTMALVTSAFSKDLECALSESGKCLLYIDVD